MKITKPRRPSADKTRDKILKTAQKLFIEHGFAGTSMGVLAKKAKVNQSLISHHFVNKAELWQHVKLSIIENIDLPRINLKPNKLKDFLTEIIQQRFNMYQQNPELIRLLSLQRLELKQKQLMSTQAGSPMQWLEPIKYLQNNGEIDKELNPYLVMVWIANSVTGILLDDHSQFDGKEINKKAYIQMLIDKLCKALSAE